MNYSTFSYFFASLSGNHKYLRFKHLAQKKTLIGKKNNIFLRNQFRFNGKWNIALHLGHLKEGFSIKNYL